MQEVRAWTIRRGTKAPGAAGVIHSDFENGFIKADCYASDDLFALGSEQAVKEKGLLRSEAKSTSSRTVTSCSSSSTSDAQPPDRRLSPAAPMTLVN